MNTKVSILHDPIYIKFENRQIYSVETEWYGGGGGRNSSGTGGEKVLWGAGHIQCHAPLMIHGVFTILCPFYTSIKKKGVFKGKK